MSTPLDANEKPDLDSPLSTSTSGEAAQDDCHHAQRSSCSKFSASVHVPPPGGGRSAPPDIVKQAEIAISFFLHCGTSGVVSTSCWLAQFDADSLQQSPSAVSVTGYVQLVKDVRPTAMNRWHPQCKWTMVHWKMKKMATKDFFSALIQQIRTKPHQ
jgi:hypothetical protein